MTPIGQRGANAPKAPLRRPPGHARSPVLWPAGRPWPTSMASQSAWPGRSRRCRRQKPSHPGATPPGTEKRGRKRADACTLLPAGAYGAETEGKALSGVNTMPSPPAGSIMGSQQSRYRCDPSPCRPQLPPPACPAPDRKLKLIACAAAPCALSAHPSEACTAHPALASPQPVNASDTSCS